MRKQVLFAWIAAVVVLLGAGGFFFVKYRQAHAAFTAMKAQDEETRTRYSNAIGEIAMIQDSLNAIVLGNSETGLVPANLQAERHLSETQGDVALAKIAVLKAGIERTKEKIQQLDRDLKKSGVKVAGLQKMVANLRKSVAEKEEQVAQLTSQVGDLQTQVSGLTETVEQNQDSLYAQAQQIERNRREIGTVYVLIGTKHELTSSGAVVAKGGFFGIGKTLEPSGKVDESMFTTLDTDQQQVIHIPSARARVLSQQPVASYSLEPEGKETLLRITDPTEFRKVKHVLIMTT
jgi:septal ring factor EnvC (AmiA/AmiB activator)